MYEGILLMGKIDSFMACYCFRIYKAVMKGPVAIRTSANDGEIISTNKG